MIIQVKANNFLPCLGLETGFLTSAGGCRGTHLVERLINPGSGSVLYHYNSRNDQELLELLPSALKREVELHPAI